MEQRCVIRYNYRQTRFERLLGDRSAFARLRVPLALAGAALLALPATWTIEAGRLAALDAELTAIQSRVAAESSDRARAEHIAARVERLRKMRVLLALARRDGLAATNAIANIGNGLPAQTWLTALGATPSGSWTIAGRSTRVDEIGTMLRRVQSIDAAASARLISVAASGRTGRVLDFTIGWERRP